MYQVQLITRPEELSTLAATWQACFDALPNASFFHTREWLEEYCCHYHDQIQLRVLVVHFDGQPVGILPLAIRTQRRGFGKVRVLGYVTECGGPWHGPISAEPEATVRAGLQFLRTLIRDWDVLDLQSNVVLNTASAEIKRSIHVGGLTCSQQPHETAAIVEFTGTWEEYLAAKPKKVRHEIRRVLRKTFDNCDTAFIRHRPAPAAAGDGDPRWDLFEQCEQVAAASWQARSNKVAALTDERSVSFRRATHAAASRLGMVDLNVLTVAGEPVSFSYSYFHQGRLTGQHLAYDASVSPTGVGRALVLRSLEDSFARGDHSYHMGQLDSRLKIEVLTRCETSYRLNQVPLTSWRGTLDCCVTWAKSFGAAANAAKSAKPAWT